jgi:hypothetical protein
LNIHSDRNDEDFTIYNNKLDNNNNNDSDRLLLDDIPRGKVSLSLSLLGVTSIASSISYISNGFIFIGSIYGDSQLVRLKSSKSHGDVIIDMEKKEKDGEVNNVGKENLENTVKNVDEEIIGKKQKKMVFNEIHHVMPKIDGTFEKEEKDIDDNNNNNCDSVQNDIEHIFNSDETFFRQHDPSYSCIEVVDQFDNIGPVVDFAVVNVGLDTHLAGTLCSDTPLTPSFPSSSFSSSSSSSSSSSCGGGIKSVSSKETRFFPASSLLSSSSIDSSQNSISLLSSPLLYPSSSPLDSAFKKESLCFDYTSLTKDHTPVVEPALVTCSGGYKDGSIRVIHRGVGIHQIVQQECPGIRNLWTLVKKSNNIVNHQTGIEKFLVLGYAMATRVLGLNEENNGFVLFFFLF